MNSFMGRDQDIHHPCDCSHFCDLQHPKTTTAALIVTRTLTIPVVTAGILRSATSKTMTISWIVTRTHTVEISDIKNDDCYKNDASGASKKETVTRI